MLEVEITPPDWMAEGEITIRLVELQPDATAALIENLRDVTETNDNRIRLLLRLWDARRTDRSGRRGLEAPGR